MRRARGDVPFDLRLSEVGEAADALGALVSDMDVRMVPIAGVGVLMGLIGAEIERLAVEAEAAPVEAGQRDRDERIAA